MKAPKLNDERVRPLNRKGDRELRYFQKMITQDLHIKELRKLLDQAEADIAALTILAKDQSSDIAILKDRIAASEKLKAAETQLLTAQIQQAKQELEAFKEKVKGWDTWKLYSEINTLTTELYQLKSSPSIQVLEFLRKKNPDYLRHLKKKLKLKDL